MRNRLQKRFIWADQMALPWPNTTKIPIGVTMILVSQVPKWNCGIYVEQVAWQWFGFDQAPSDSVALGRSRGMTGSDVTKSPSDLVAFAYQKVLHWFGHNQGPKWYNMVLWKANSRGKPEAALEQLRVTTHDVKEQIPCFSWGSSLLYLIIIYTSS